LVEVVVIVGVVVAWVRVSIVVECHSTDVLHVV